MMIDLTYGGKSPLTVNNPVLLASGVAGYDGGPYSGVIDLSKLGAIVTNPLTWRPRHAANGPRVVPLPAGVLVHTGLPNPGVRRAIKLYRALGAEPAPVIAHVVATTVEDVAASVAELERCEAIAGIELGLHDRATPRDVELILRAAQDATMLPLMVRLPLYTALDLAPAAQDAGAGALVVSAPPRGTVRDPLSGQLAGGEFTDRGSKRRRCARWGRSRGRCRSRCSAVAGSTRQTTRETFSTRARSPCRSTRCCGRIRTWSR